VSAPCDGPSLSAHSFRSTEGVTVVTVVNVLVQFRVRSTGPPAWGLLGYGIHNHRHNRHRR
jgi:hypothetical protein